MKLTETEYDNLLYGESQKIQEEVKRKQQEIFERAKKKRLKQKLDRQRNLRGYTDWEAKLAEKKKIIAIQQKKLDKLNERVKQLEYSLNKTKGIIQEIPIEKDIEERETIEI